MAKTGGSLFGRADASLVSAAFREGMTKGPGDLSDVYKLQADTNTMMWEAIQKGFDEVFGDTIARNEELQEATDAMLSEFSGGTAYDDEMMYMYDNEIKDIKERMKGVEKDSLEERKLYNELERLKSSTDKYGQTLLNIGTFINNNEHNVGATGDNIPLLTSIFNKTAKKRINNGNLEFSMDGKDWKNWKDIQKSMIAKDHANHSGMLKRSTDELNFYKTNTKAVYGDRARQGNINWIYDNSFKTQE